jgi:GTP:adenosylcobinamide-phosphate guanylyltransferase
MHQFDIRLNAFSVTYEPTTGISPGFMEIGGEPVINWWMRSLRECPRLLPVSDKVTIVTSPSTHADYQEWASNRCVCVSACACVYVCV